MSYFQIKWTKNKNNEIIGHLYAIVTCTNNSIKLYADFLILLTINCFDITVSFLSYPFEINSVIDSPASFLIFISFLFNLVNLLRLLSSFEISLRVFAIFWNCPHFPKMLMILIFLSIDYCYCYYLRLSFTGFMSILYYRFVKCYLCYSCYCY